MLIVYYSFTQQTRVLLKKFVEGLEEEGIEVAQERLNPVQPFDFPFKSDLKLGVAMIQTFFRKRMEIHPVSDICFEEWDCIVLAGPTWSYHPSGPVLDFLDRYGRKICAGTRVVPFISCRSYYQFHNWSIKRQLIKAGAVVLAPIVFEHPIREPWRFIGLILQLRGKMVRKNNSWFRKHYPGYGHSREQGGQARQAGRLLGAELVQDSVDV